MLRSLLFASLTAVGLALPLALPASAQAAHHYRVEYRDAQWHERVFDCPRQTREFENRLERRGYDVRVRRHGDHFHVRYRSTDWRDYRTVSSHRHAHELVNVLRGRGYECRVIHR